MLYSVSQFFAKPMLGAVFIMAANSNKVDVTGHINYF